jgi:hypothetical protein
MKQVYGTVLHKEGRFLLEVEGKRYEIPEAIAFDRKHIADLVGKRVNVAFGDSPIIVFDDILCYVAPDGWAWAGQVEIGKREVILQGFVKAGYLTEEKFNQLMQM